MKLMLNPLSKVSMRADPGPMYSIGVSQFIVVKSHFLVRKFGEFQETHLVYHMCLTGCHVKNVYKW